MADNSPSIFNKRATDKLRSPDDLDRYVRVTNPSIWMLLGACIALLAGLLAWGVFGAVSTSVTTMAVRQGDSVMCLLTTEGAQSVRVGDVVSVEGVSMEVESIGETPISSFEAWEALQSDYLVSVLMKEEWAFLVTLSGDASSLREGIPLNASIETERVAPISLVLGGGM